MRQFTSLARRIASPAAISRRTLVSSASLRDRVRLDDPRHKDGSADLKGQPVLEQGFLASGAFFVLFSAYGLMKTMMGEDTENMMLCGTVKSMKAEESHH